MKKKVSVVIPAYNAEEYVERMLKSILNQTYSDVECIVVNDGSTDSTQKILEQYKEKFTQKNKELKIINQENKGQAAAVNRALKFVTGEYFVWADADDFFELDAFENMVKYLEENDDVDSVRANAIYRLENEIEKIYKINKQRYFGKYEILDDYIKYREETIPCYIGIIMTRFKYFSKKNKGLDINESRVGQNLQLIIPITYNAKTGCLNKEVYNYVIREDSHSRQNRNKIQRIKRAYEAKKLRIETINKIMNKEDIFTYQKIIKTKFYQKILKELLFINYLVRLKNKLKRIIKKEQ